MNRRELVEAIAEKQKMPAPHVDRVLDSFFEVIEESVGAGETIHLRMFGKFEPRHRAAVTRKNPKTGIEHDVPAKLSLGFVPSAQLKSRLNQT